MELVDYIYDECKRQHVTNYGDFAKAWNFAAIDGGMPNGPENFGLFVEFIAMYVQPSDNEIWDISKGNLRTSHVGFMNGGSAAPVREVRERFDRWCEFAFEWITANQQRKDAVDSHNFELAVRLDSVANPGIAESLIKALLDIHPWVDGNGRTASILRNWMLGTLDDPSPLPYYYGE